jgi:ComF family protein
MGERRARILLGSRSGTIVMGHWAAHFKDIAAAAHGTTVRMLFPPTCAGCLRLVEEPGTLCGKCWPRLRLLDRPWCPVMGTPFAHDMGEGFLSGEAIARPPPFERARAAVAYAGVARQMVQRLKYHDRTDLAPWMARWMVRAGFELMPDIDLIVPVPLHGRRFFRRRFNQSAELARAVGRLTGLPFEPAIVERIKVTRQQVGLGQREREDNVRAAFAVPARCAAGLKARRVLLVDDVYTTGATVAAVTRALRKGGAAAVDVLTFARVLPGDFLPDA